MLVMAEAYARQIARVAAGQLAEISGFESVQESAVDILGDLLLRYMDEVASGACGYAELAGRSDANVHDVLMSLDNLGVMVEELRDYLSSISPVS